MSLAPVVGLPVFPDWSKETDMNLVTLKEEGDDSSQRHQRLLRSLAGYLVVQVGKTP